MYLEEVIDGVVDAENERSNTDHVRSPRHHDQTQRRHVVNDHLPEVLHQQSSTKPNPELTFLCREEQEDEVKLRRSSYPA